ncbi:MAG: hypothetical protein GY951_06270 [Psychromonas sp.]|nr:hypothetical protein [Alteromonadales bacterium]MCP5077647.1 hypothetical protein [Psychromonas sp.]
MMMDISTQLTNLFTLEKELSSLLDNEDYEAFQRQQDTFTDQIKALLDNTPQEVLITVIEQLKTLEHNVGELRNRSDIHFQKLKEKSLLQQRNKSKINAYK